MNIGGPQRGDRAPSSTGNSSASTSVNTSNSTNNGGGEADFALNVQRITNGLEKRTTVMVRLRLLFEISTPFIQSFVIHVVMLCSLCSFLKVRNIPNKYTQAMLLEEVNARHRGCYDFFYLPIDFKNRCNVGYAFINFLSPVYIPQFVEDFHGTRWRSFNSEKVCAVSFARIQGKAAMIARFQNSSLLEKDDEYQPLLFYSSGPLVGQPEPFPVNHNSSSSNNNNLSGGAVSAASGAGHTSNSNSSSNGSLKVPRHHQQHQQQQQQQQLQQASALAPALPTAPTLSAQSTSVVSTAPSTAQSSGEDATVIASADAPVAGPEI